MKKVNLFFFVILICLTSNLKAQDTIVQKNGSKIISKISEVSPSRIKYKIYENQAGPDYYIEKSSVREIHFQNGYIQQYDESEQNPVTDETEYINDIPVKKKNERSDERREDRREDRREERMVNEPRDDFESINPRIRMGQKYRENKQIYNSSMYIPQYGDPYNPTTAGIASFFIPGLGQMLSGEVGRGLAFMGGYYGSYLVTVIGASMVTDGIGYYGIDNNYNYNYNYNNYSNTGMYLLIAGGIAALTTYIWSIFDAVKVAKVNNMYMQDLRNNRVSIQLKPYIETKTYPNITDRPVGMSVQISF